eukprot:1156268-Pelagomonas_calceolata.AAC.5
MAFGIAADGRRHAHEHDREHIPAEGHAIARPMAFGIAAYGAKQQESIIESTALLRGTPLQDRRHLALQRLGSKASTRAH